MAIHLDELPNKFCVSPSLFLYHSLSLSLSLDFPLINSILSTENLQGPLRHPLSLSVRTLRVPSGKPTGKKLTSVRQLTGCNFRYSMCCTLNYRLISDPTIETN